MPDRPTAGPALRIAELGYAEGSRCGFLGAAPKPPGLFRDSGTAGDTPTPPDLARFFKKWYTTPGEIWDSNRGLTKSEISVIIAGEKEKLSEIFQRLKK